MNLINKKLLQQKMLTFEFPSSEKLANAKKLLEGWQKALKNSDLEKTKEKSVQGKFLSTFFEAILGYSDVTTGNEEWTLIQHPRIENDSKEPDGSLGWFTKDKKTTKAVIELKDARTLLDKRQNRGSEKLTPIEQAYLYATKYEGCNWIIVSNFKEIRLYNKNKTQEYYEKFEVIDLIQEAELKRFYFLLSHLSLISKDKESLIDNLAKDTIETEQDITKQFYAEYRETRLHLLDHLIKQNEGISKIILLEKTQKLLDRFIFTLFCEDTSSLLPFNIVKNTYERAVNSLSPSDERVWNEFKGLFLAIDKGNSRVKPPINAYNGGLFAFDDVLDNLSIKDDIWATLIHLAEYDFDTDLNVNILGHIFEQSISDLESLKSELDGENLDKTKSKRKKDGIYYTPEYITRYIVENTVGKYLEEHPDKLDTIKVLDPACGSGAFLNQAHSFLANEYELRYQSLIADKLSKGEEISLFDYNPAENNKSILLNNLFGVDLNQESVEITKLGLWLKTARSSEPLQNLDKNIKCGNSLIDDAEVAGNKAHNWGKEYYDQLQPELVLIDSGAYTKEVKNLENKGIIIPYWCPVDSIYFNRLNEAEKKDIESSIEKGESNELLDSVAPIKWVIYPIDLTSSGDVYIDGEIKPTGKGIITQSKEEMFKPIEKELYNLYGNDLIKKNQKDFKILITLILSGKNERKFYRFKKNALETEEQLVAKHLNKNISKLITNDKKGLFKDGYRKKLNEKFNIKVIYTGEVNQTNFSSGGFDIVLGNPPYVRQELIKEIKPYLEQNYKIYTGVADLYVYFFEKGLSLLQDGGYFAFIVSDKFTRANYGKPLRKWLLEHFTIIEYVKSFGEQVFDGVTVDPCIIIIKKEKPKAGSKVKITDFKSMVEVNSFEMNQTDLTEEPWNFVGDSVFRLKAKIESLGIKIKNLEGVKINYGIKTGFNEAFIIDEIKKNELISKDPKSLEIIKPLLRGRDLKRYSYEHAGLYIIGTFPSLKIDIEKYPSVKEHLLTFGKERLEQSGLQGARKKTGNKWFETQDQIAYWQDFTKPKILYPEIVSEHGFALDTNKYYINNKLFLITGKEILSIIAILNSKLGKFLAHQYCVPLGDSGFEYRKIFIEQIPIILPTDDQKALLEDMVEKITALSLKLKQFEKSAQSLLMSNYNLTRSISFKLGFNELLEEFVKQKVKLSLDQKEELQVWYKRKQKDLNDLHLEINSLDSRIDQEVYKLYKLTPDEIAIIEKSA